MRPLEMDFRRSPRPSPWGWVLCLAGIATLAALLESHREIRAETSLHRATVHTIEARLPGASAFQIAMPVEDAGLTAARQTLAQGKHPWEELFAALESADNQDVAVLAVIPEAARGKVKIQAEARNLAAMLAYHQRLEKESGLRQVALLEHDAASEAAEGPVRFHILVAWGAGHGHP